MYGIPVGVVEAKKPQTLDKCKSLLDDVKILGQLFDHLSHLRTYAWRQYAFGILTTNGRSVGSLIVVMLLKLPLFHLPLPVNI